MCPKEFSTLIPEPGNILDQPEEDVGVEGSLVSLVDDHDAVARQVRLGQEFSEQHSVRHVLEQRPLRRAVLEPDAVADLVSDSQNYFFLRH